MANAPEKKEPKKISDRLVDFIQKYRLVLLVGISAVVVAFIALGVSIAVIDSTNERAIAAVEGFAERYDAIKASDESKREADTQILVEELEGFAKSHSGYAKARAYSILAGIQDDKKNWAEAETAWLAAADALPKSYLAPVSVYNAATAAEERGDGTKALELYAKCADTYGTSFSQAPRAYLAIGRLNEERKDFEAASVAYKKIVDSWPNDSWAKLAHGRLIAISDQGTK